MNTQEFFKELKRYHKQIRATDNTYMVLPIQCINLNYGSIEYSIIRHKNLLVYATLSTSYLIVRDGSASIDGLKRVGLPNLLSYIK